MTIETDLHDIINSKYIEDEFNLNLFSADKRISSGILVERALINIINDSNYFSSDFHIPSFFKKSFTGGYEFILNNRSVFEIDDYKNIGGSLVYLEVKSGEIPNRYLDTNYKSRKDKYGTNVDIKKIFSINDKFNLNPNLIIFYNKELMKNSRLLKRIQNQYPGRIQKVAFNFDYNYAREIVDKHNKLAIKYQRRKKTNLEELY